MDSKLYSYTLYIWREPNIGMNFNAMVHIFYITVPARIYTRERAFFFSHIYTYCLPSHLPFFRRAWRRMKGSAVRDSLRGDRTCMDLSKTIFYAFNRRLFLCVYRGEYGTCGTKWMFKSRISVLFSKRSVQPTACCVFFNHGLGDKVFIASRLNICHWSTLDFESDV